MLAHTHILISIQGKKKLNYTLLQFNVKYPNMQELDEFNNWLTFNSLISQDAEQVFELA